MTIHELKKYIQNLPDDMNVYIEYSDKNGNDIEVDINSIETGIMEHEETGEKYDSVFIKVSIE